MWIHHISTFWMWKQCGAMWMYCVAMWISTFQMWINADILWVSITEIYVNSWINLKLMWTATLKNVDPPHLHILTMWIHRFKRRLNKVKDNYQNCNVSYYINAKYVDIIRSIFRLEAYRNIVLDGVQELQRQSELPRPIPRNFVESDHGCTSRIYFNNAGDNVALTL